MQHGIAIDPEPKRVRVGYRAAPVVGDGFDHFQSGAKDNIVDGAGSRISRLQRDRSIGSAVTTPGASLGPVQADFRIRVAALV
jgi:hypothetical protein